METGVFPATPTTCMIGESKSGKQFVKVLFNVKFKQGTKALSWSGWLTPKAIPYTLKAMFKVGLTSKTLTKLMNGEDGSKCINTHDDVDVTVQKQRDQEGGEVVNDKGEPYYEVSYIGGVSLESDQKALNNLDKNNILSTMMKMEETMGKTNTQFLTQFSTDDIPF